VSPANQQIGHNMVFRPIDVARELNVSVSTIRNWSKEFGEYLSPGARPGAGARQFTPHDLQVLRAVAELRRQNLPREQIADHLQTRTFGEVDGVHPAHPQQATATLQPPAAPQPYDPGAALLQSTTATLQSISDRLAERDAAGVQSVRREVEGLRVWIYILAAVVVVLVIAVIVLFVGAPGLDVD
jgi:DNA-binding transcriptional MerR regulator